MGAIYAKDFASCIRDKRSNTWTWSAGALRHVVKALAGRQVAIELDNMTGYTQCGVLLHDVRGRRSGGYGIAVADKRCETPQNPHGITVFADHKVGVIIALEGISDKYDAIDSERREHGLALDMFKATFSGTPTDGKWEVTSHAYEVHVSYTPGAFRRGSGEFDRFSWKSYSLAQIEAASLCTGCLRERESQIHEPTCPTRS